ncbi:uncharacterized protein PAC_00232 [Phialocephala subalpina]|uniref:Uncharacterized protein n=1 Tax=Phialocephala subalpina TaxID=576137 RepID=A0A1L7WC54_9HELO|nr:uncharacterized protein PAC_00232 [Phialocephala subalpina]
MAANTLPFRLKSYQTALAIVAPPQLHSDINSLRKIHDKAYEKWDPHINVLYPFVDPDQLGAAIAELRQRIAKQDVRSFDINLPEPDKFVQKRSATVHLKPDSESEARIGQLRADLVDALGRDAKEGTHDGTFRAHMTIGQAGLVGPTLGMLLEKVEKLAPLEWQCRSLAVLKRQPSGKMALVDEIRLLGDENIGSDENGGEQDSAQHWKRCNAYNPSEGWQELHEKPVSKATREICGPKIIVSTYNLMADQHAPPFASRLGPIIDAITSVTEQLSNTRVLCLQEVNDEMLPLLLGHPSLNNTYPFSTHQPSSLLPSQRNLVIMASVPFSHTTLEFDERHKSALVVDLFGMCVKVVNTHLSSALTDDAVVTKKNQMDTLTKFCLDPSMTGDFIVAGDFNISTSSQTIETALDRGLIGRETARMVRTVINEEIWEDTFLASPQTLPSASEEIFDGEEGATFDRIGNPLASMSISPIDNRPQRYDRILYRKNGKLKVDHVQLFGLPNGKGHCGSDHYGFSATLKSEKVQDSLAEEPSLLSQSTMENLVVMQDSMDLYSLLRSQLPTEEDREQRTRAIGLLQDVLSSGKGLSNLVLAPLGSYLMGTYFPDSDVDLLAIGSVAPRVFFETATSSLQHINSQPDGGVKGVHLVNSLVSIMELCVFGIKFDLQYCQASLLLEKYHSPSTETPLHELAFDTTLIGSLPPSSLRPFNTYRDTAYILNTIPDITSYRAAHRFLSLYLKIHGLYSAKFGYLGGIHLSLMLNRAVKLMSAQLSLKKQSGLGDAHRSYAAIIVRTFFDYYSNFNWPSESIADPDLNGKTQPTRSPRDAVFIPAIHVPTARPNVAGSCTPLSARTFASEFKEASSKLSQGNWDWCLRPGAGVATFLNGFSAYISISLDAWSVDEVRGAKVRDIIGALESRLPRLMLALGRLDGIYARVWPARFRTRNDGTLEDATQFKGYYLIGIRMTDEHADIDTKQRLKGKVVGAVRDFESNVKAYIEFESGNCWLDAEFLGAKKIKDIDLVIDERNWSGEDSPSPDATDSNVNDRREDLEDPKFADLSVGTTLEQPRRPNSSPLRMPDDVMNRIKHDTAHYSAKEFFIGYEDRFEEKPKEVDLLKWKLEQTDEEFIPLHRVVHIRRKDENGGEVVWDRRLKLDLVFGSGKRRAKITY